MIKVYSGQSLFEVLFSVAIASILLIGVVSLAATSVRNTSFSLNNALATEFAQEGSEWIRQYRDADWDEFKSHSSGGAGSNWCINSLPYPPPAWGLPSSCGTATITGTIFTRDINLTDDAINAGLVEVTISVNWTDSQGVHTVRSISKLADWNR
ncbi:hypothetical protein A2962_04745 [Candidatus Woesebacteria bacterium RIFCSPLOWO2_01_FULL_39_61]|uniref:Type IV pilus modification protein PilV n=1 Tax=Candidatus Woesebacteria bacterium RIFCSPHIGHO2_02_FULL_39_13 TaxID=1802505 RepID=A0A1F7Z5V8_9BACT|nr:MAG: hypothetical protein A2692_01065 [Candidatus Woesebacteria bacterium RIFCSPHIGHO2_01_FULL_39_95]OGM34308.1 MAG: hypothetical protein A3D01_00870 [Candidatus Woesebacteria bacterium RIFCSPHIGHO2_02_FULL_39_13]OGM39090.1 MAG: hypothetical protein A3E13_01595 [Candidatus Woesebacteria bacterium RIFCSPHIGHO2_12_FULL_40_20]OGM68645.1 MAG: hypothetical protein A2962_04745 [Candidatus Woesebacteria bacterium RIFCSPLOWO2_01_FULL_39_61]OGM73501.1 MAG: hypothetical protein A3H19_00340 [Candidatus